MVEKLRVDLLQREVNVKADGVQVAYRQVRKCPMLLLQQGRAQSGAAILASAQWSAACSGSVRRALQPSVGGSSTSLCSLSSHRP